MTARHTTGAAAFLLACAALIGPALAADAPDHGWTREVLPNGLEVTVVSDPRHELAALLARGLDGLAGLEALLEHGLELGLAVRR